MRGHEYNLLGALGSYMQVFFDVSAQSLLGSPFEDACLLWPLRVNSAMLFDLGIWTAPATQSPAWAQLQTREGPSPSECYLRNPFLTCKLTTARYLYQPASHTQDKEGHASAPWEWSTLNTQHGRHGSMGEHQQLVNPQCVQFYKNPKVTSLSQASHRGHTLFSALHYYDAR